MPRNLRQLMQWGNFCQAGSHQQKVKERLRQNARMLAYYRRRSDRLDVKVRTTQRALFGIVNWPLLIVTAIVAYGFGASEWRTYLTSAKHFLGL
jgi:hypothetical protein